MQIRSVGIDLGKTTFHLVALGTSATALRSAMDEILQLGSAWCHDSIRTAARPSCWASASAATSTCVRY
jgi:hypothetical protein